MSFASRTTALATRIGNYFRDSILPRLLPSGGTTGQVLAKTTGTNYVVGWVTPAAGSGGANGFNAIFMRAAGQFIATCLNGIAMGTLTGTANRIEVHPFRPDADITIDLLELSVTTAVAASVFKLAIYASDPATNLPTGAPLRGTTDMSGAAIANVQQAITPLTLTKGTLYWFGCHFSAATIVRANAQAAMFNLGLFSGSSAPLTVIRGTQTYASGLPLGSAFTAANLAAALGASIRMRLA